MKVFLLLALFAGAKAGYLTLPSVAVREAPSQTQLSASTNGNIYYSDYGGQYSTSVAGNGVGAVSPSSSSGSAGSVSHVNSAPHSDVPTASAGPANTVAAAAAPPLFSVPVATFPVSSGPHQVYAASAVPVASIGVSPAPRYAGSYGAPALVSYPVPSQSQSPYRPGPTVTSGAPPAVFPVNARLRYTTVSAAPPRYAAAPSAPQLPRFTKAVFPATYSAAPSSARALGPTSAAVAVGVPVSYSPAGVATTYSTRVESAPVYAAPVAPRYVLTPFQNLAASGIRYTSGTADASGASVFGQTTAAHAYGAANIGPVVFDYVSPQIHKLYGGGYGSHVKYVS